MLVDHPVQPVDVAVVGAGAAGLAAAIFTARRRPTLTVVALDGARKLGAKILVAGGGRCNVTNRVVTAGDYNGGSPNVIRRVLRAFPVERTITFFRDIGVPLHEEQHGKLFPDSQKARSVLHALLAEAQRSGVTILTEHRVTEVRHARGLFHLDTSRCALVARRVVLATGGLSLPKTGSDGSGYRFAERLGHSLVPTTPALVPLVLEGDFHTPLAGIAQEVQLAISVTGRPRISLRGALLWTHFGVSGPAVLDASRHWHRARIEERPAAITASLLPGDDFGSAERKLLDLTDSQPRLALRKALALRLPARVADAVLQRRGIDGSTALAHLTRDTRRNALRALLAWVLPIRDSRGYGHAEVTAGGVPLSEVDPATMASRRCPGLFLAGEMLDVDGRIGGFNFQWSWSSAWVAAAGLAAHPPADG